MKLIDSTDEFMAAKAERKASLLIQSKGIPSAQAANKAKLIPKLRPSEVKILKFCE